MTSGSRDKSEVSNLLPLAVLYYVEVFRAEAVYVVTARVGDNGIDLHQVHVKVNRVIRIGSGRDVLRGRRRCLPILSRTRQQPEDEKAGARTPAQWDLPLARPSSMLQQLRACLSLLPACQCLHIHLKSTQ